MQKVLLGKDSEISAVLAKANSNSKTHGHGV